MGLQQTQLHCPQCNEPTLHTRFVRDIPHLVHALVTLFLCGFWLPIWLLDVFMDKSGSIPFLCQKCGCDTWGRYNQQQYAQRMAQQAAALPPPKPKPVPAGHCPTCRVAGHIYQVDGGFVMFCPKCRERVE